MQIFAQIMLCKIIKMALPTVMNECQHSIYSEVPNRRADRNKRAGLEKSATLLAYTK